MTDLNRPPDIQTEERQGRRSHRRTLSDKGRSILRNGESLLGRTGFGRRYAPIEESSPSPPHTNPVSPRAYITTPSGTHLPADDTEDGSFSPMADRGGFQEAMGFAGLSFHGEANDGETSSEPPIRANRSSLPSLVTSSESSPLTTQHDVEDSPDYFSSLYADTTPLTDSTRLHAHSGRGSTTPTGQRHDRERSSFQSVRFLTPDISPGSRPGDNLSNIEAGVSDGSINRSGSSKRSLSPSSAESPLHRAGTIVKKMSQRVVNLSNEPEVVERSIRRRSSVKQPRLDEHSPALPPVTDYNSDGAASMRSPTSEKLPSPILGPADTKPWEPPSNPLKGKSMGIFPPESKLRKRLCDLLVHPATEPFILVLIVIQTVLLAVDASRSVFDDPRSQRWGTSWIDYGLLGLFAIYTIEAVVRVIVSGFIINPEEYSTIDRQVGFRQAVLNKFNELFALHKQTTLKHVGSSFQTQQPSIIRSFTGTHSFNKRSGGLRQNARERLAHRAFLRHSFNRLDFVAVVSFWISFIIGVLGVESSRHAYVFRMLSCLRILRLLGITSGTSVILRSLKRAAPTLLNVAFLIGFFWLLFAIIGVQSFKSSLRRTCVWVDPDGLQSNFTSNFQFCGGYLDQNGHSMPWLTADGRNGSDVHKGYICPQQSVCIEGDNPYNGTVSFDNILQSLELVFVMMTSNTFSDLLYYLTDSDYLTAALFFAAGIIIMSLWLMNLLIAVITSSFQVIREESRASAFTAEEDDVLPEPDDIPKRRVSSLKRLYDKTSWLWIAIILYGLVVQCLRTADMSKDRAAFIDASELGVTVALSVDIVLRFTVDWRNFFRSRRNVVDLALAVITMVIQIPRIHNSGQTYAWLTVFQIVRIYRIVLAIQLTRDLITLVFRHVSGLLNLILFVFLLTFLAAIFAVQMFRGELPVDDASGNPIHVTFATIYNSFLGMYQILSSENWTAIVYNITAYDTIYDTAWIGAGFFILWFILANFIVLNMFIAVIQENFDVSEDEKRLQQVKAFLQRKEFGGSSQGNLSLSAIFKFGQARRQDPLDFGSAATEMLLKEAVVRDFLDEQGETTNNETANDVASERPIVAMVLLACVTTPLYQKEYFQNHTFSVKNWFVFTDLAFAALFTVEAVIKVIADGLFWTPNAYFRGSWGLIDGVVLITLWVNVATSLYSGGVVSRAVGAFKTLRALRLLNISDSARDTFHSVIVLGGWKVLSAAFVSLSLLIPFAIYGLNLFNGKMQTCNDNNSNIYNLTDCVGEYFSSPYNWNVLAPRRVANPYYDFDSFGSSLFILFQIVSQEGWIDVMWSAEDITGIFTQPSPFASQGNALFFVIFNLLGAVFVLTLFVSVFMRNYTEQTGVAFLTTDQRSWLELRKLLRQVSPSKRPSSKKKRESWKEWCYRRAITKNGRWQRTVTLVLMLHLVLLCLEFYPASYVWDRTRDYIFLAFTLFYIANIAIRMVGLTWTRFRKSSWDIYSMFAVSGTFVTTVLLLSDFRQRDYIQLHKLFLVSIALLLIPRNNQLDQLFKTAAASLTSIANLLATWFVLFLVFAIAMTQAFGLTKFNHNETDNLNFRTVPKALILLFRMSVGEGWNQIMEDFATVTPPYCVVGQHYFDGDCGSPEWARALFILWNILSMYIFVNLFISLIYESFSYVYQRSSGLSVISREEVRRFKQAWAEFDPSGSGFISKEAFPRLLGELSGIFEMRIYDGDFSVRRLVEDCKVRKLSRASELPVEGPPDPVEIDLVKLNQRMAELPIEEIRLRRTRMNIFYEEVLVSADPDRGIGFNALLMILAHYKVINDSKSLRLEEFLRRRARLQRVEEAVRRNIVIGFFDTLYWKRRFRRILDSRRSARMTAIPQFGIPEIFVQDEDVTNASRLDTSDPFVPSPILSPVELGTALDLREGHGASGSDARSVSSSAGPSTLRNRSDSIQISPSGSPTRVSAQFVPGHRPSHSGELSAEWQFANALSGFSGASSQPPSPMTIGVAEDGGRSRAGSSVSAVSARDVLDVLDNSVWGESIRRSFTLRRPSGSGSGPSQQ
ncbi:hypothetical protein LTR04_005122 [Oleoguttula sp. CCFEE 6159]|nr:hypothetical protein LTR04_005122 [Oleoguttula sp. CCFEE 6159]